MGFNSFLQGIGQGFTNGIDDIADFLGIGNARREREFQATEAEKQRQFEADQAQIARDYNTEMSNTAVQRQVADMNAAGINSAMAYSNSSASGASTPSSPSASGTSARAVGIPGSMIGQVSSLVNSVANVMNANTAQVRVDRYNKHLDYKEMQKLDTTTHEIYDGAGKLLRTFLINKLSGY